MVVPTISAPGGFNTRAALARLPGDHDAGPVRVSVLRVAPVLDAGRTHGTRSHVWRRRARSVRVGEAAT